MDSDGLPIVGPGVDYYKVQAISQKRQLSFLNHFISHTVKFLNKFSVDCEEKLENLNVKIQKIETSLAILEAKLSSVPGLDDVKPVQKDVAVNNVPAEPNNVPATVDQPESNVEQTNETQPEPAPIEEPEPKANVMTVSQDPRYAKYFKLILVGVPPAALKTKMTAEGLNPDYLDTPDAPAPEGGAPPPNNDSDSEDDSESSFSD